MAPIGGEHIHCIRIDKTIMADTIEVDLKGLDQLIKSLKGKLPVVRIGILGNGQSRQGTTSNAAIGAAHEFGTSKLPIRSWLRVPLMDNLNKYLEKSGLFKDDLLKQFIKAGSIIPIMQKIAVVAENVVADGFGSNGFGKWAPWKGNYQSNSGNILDDTGQLKRSVTSDVK